MSLKSRKSIDMAGPDNHEERVTSFRKESDGKYTKIIKFIVRDWKTGQVKKSKQKDLEDGPYILCEKHKNPEDSFEIQDAAGNTLVLYFKRESDGA